MSIALAAMRRYSYTICSSETATFHLRMMSTESMAAVTRLKDSGFIKTQGLVGGRWVDAQDGKTLKVENPATGDLICTVPYMGPKETSQAISSAYETFQSWSKLSGAERSKHLRKWYDLLTAHKEELAQLVTLEQGKPMKEALVEITYGADFIEFYAEEAKRVYGDIAPSPLTDRRVLILKQPVGIVGAITPWNFPLAMITRKGAFNVVMGNASEIGDTLLASPQVRMITFTGSTAVGKKLMAGAAETVKKVSLELGGNAPCIVFDDAELDVAVKGALAAKFRNSGQTCVCANRILVQEGIYEKFANAFSAGVQQLQVGNGLTDGVAQGPLINQAAVQKVESFILDATNKGAKVLVGGKRHSLGMTFYEPTVLANTNAEMLTSREEIFGPVAPLLRFKTEEEAIHMANDTNAGLAAYVFTNDISRSWRMTEALEYGVVGVNEGLVSTVVAPFGGHKQSGLGREGSKYGMDEYLELKYVCLGNMKSA